MSKLLIPALVAIVVLAVVFFGSQAEAHTIRPKGLIISKSGNFNQFCPNYLSMETVGSEMDTCRLCCREEVGAEKLDKPAVISSYCYCKLKFGALN